MADNLTESRIVYFFEAVRCGTIRAAADWLDVAPSAVSRQIGLLETELDATLIERHAGTLRYMRLPGEVNSVSLHWPRPAGPASQGVA